MTGIERRVLECLDDEEGQDRFNIRMQTGLRYSQISDGLQRLRVKGLAKTSRWRETSVWWRTTPKA